MKVSWYKIDKLTPQRFEELGEALKRRKYSGEIPTGFRVDSIRRDLIEGTYIERTEFVEQIIDPLGGTIDIPRLRYESTDFRVRRTFPQLELIEAPRSTNGLISEISKGLDMAASIDKPEISVWKWFAAIEESFAKIEVRQMVYSDLPISTSTTGHVTVSGIKDVRRDAKKFIGENKAVLSRMGFVIKVESTSISCEISATCRATVDAEEGESVINKIRRALNAAMPDGF